jgi:O-methyltransferase involved in polyketide biosynthesis
MNLSKVSQTAILTLVCRVVEAEKSNPLFSDPMAVLCLQRLMSISSEEEKNRFTKWKRMYAGIQARDQRARALTVKNFDDIANRFISDHPGCTVVNLACGFDTRFWRIENRKCRYIELDLPAIIDLKGELLKDHLGYELIACSILDPTWIDQVTSHGSSDFLLLAEGLFMYLPKEDATRLLREVSRRFSRSQLVLDMAPEKYTKGLWKWLLALEARVWGLDVSIAFGIDNPRDIESYGSGFKFIGDAKGSMGRMTSASINAAGPGGSENG